MDAFRNLKANPDAIGACAPCQNNEIDADGHILVGGEPWCRDCIECYSDACTLCNAVVDADDLHYLEDGEYVCYDCLQISKATDAQLWARYHKDQDEAHSETMMAMELEGYDTDRLIAMMRADAAAGQCTFKCAPGDCSQCDRARDVA